MVTLLKNDPIDLLLTADGDMFVGPQGVVFTSGADGVAQAVSIRLKLFVNEWCLNLDAGVDWWQVLGEKFSDPNFVRGEISREIKATPGINRITKLEFSLDDSTRVLSIVFAASTVFGDSIPDTTVVVPIG